MANRYEEHLRHRVDDAELTGRWTIGRKAALLELLRRDFLTVADACVRYGLSAEEIATWRNRNAAHGLDGLAVTKLQEVGR